MARLGAVAVCVFVMAPVASTVELAPEVRMTSPLSLPSKPLFALVAVPLLGAGARARAGGAVGGLLEYEEPAICNCDI